MTAKTNNIRSYRILTVLIYLFVFAGCKKDDHNPTLPKDSQEDLMSRVEGSYTANGSYGRELFENVTITFTKKIPIELEVSGPDFPAFRIVNFEITYQSAANGKEYVIDAKTVAPHTGSVSFIFPEKKLLVTTTLQVNATTKRLLFVEGVKN